MNLANKYRPAEFDDIVGQDHIINILKNEIQTNTLKHSYLFIGPSGCAKTTTARIIAQKCNADIIELDMASNGNADTMRELVQYIQTKPIHNDYYVVILDEVQAAMSRKDSMAAQILLKTLEEPPLHVIFILCTTEGNKIIDTIKSRCEIHIFKEANTKDIEKRLVYICKQENIVYEDMSLYYIAQNSQNNYRYSIMSLETLIKNKKLYTQDVLDYFGTAPEERYYNLLINIHKKQTDKIIEEKLDLQYLTGFFEYILDIMIYKNTNKTDIVSIKNINQVSKISKDIMITVYDLSEILCDILIEAKNSPIIRQLFIAKYFARK